MIGLMPFMPPSGGPPLTLFSDSTGSNYPAGLQNGDIGILLETRSFATTAASPPGGLTAVTGMSTMLNHSVPTSYLGPGQNAETKYGHYQARISQRSLTASLSGTAIGGAPTTRRLLVFRHPAALTVQAVVMKSSEFTSTYIGSVSYAAQPSPILPIFAVAAARENGVSFPALSFDGAAPTYYDLSSSGALCRIGALLGPQSPRTIAFNLGSSGAAFPNHAAYNLRRT